MKWKVLFGALACFLLIFVIFYFLMQHLYSIQTPERLRYVKDYQEFTLSIDAISDCTNEMQTFFQLDDVVYQGMCIRSVYVNYGRTKAPLEMVLREGYITLTDIQKKLNRKQVFVIGEEFQELSTPQGNVTWYDYRRSEKEDGNYLVTIATRNYQNQDLTEVTFEPLFD